MPETRPVENSLNTPTVIKNTFSEHGNEIEDIISSRPPFIVRWGTLVFFALLLLLIAISWFIQYPDTIDVGAILTGENAPKEIIPRQSGKIVQVLKNTNAEVKEGEVIGWIESTGNTVEVIDLDNRLQEAIKALNNSSDASIAALFTKKYSNLGDLQLPYQSFTTTLQSYNDYLVNGFYRKKQQMLQSDISSLSEIKRQSSEQKNLSSQDIALSQKSYDMNERLFKEGVISAEEYRQAQSKLLNNRKTLPQSDISILSQQNSIRDKQKEIHQLSHEINQQRYVFEQAVYTLKSSVDDWIKKYAIQAPATGQLVFVLPLQKDQHIEQGKTLGYVNPLDSKFFAEVKLPQVNFGKIDTGMKVQIRLDAYPYNEVGYIEGQLNYISKIAIDSGFIGTVRLNKGLVTNYNKPIQYKNGLKGTAVIITKEMRLLERFYYNIKKETNR